jgi:effector-binding domain-containing protein
MAKVKLEKRKPLRLAYVEHTGDYGEIPFEKYMEKLYGWAKAHKVRPGMQGYGIYHDSPEEKPPEELRSEIAIPIYGEAEPEGDVRVKDLPAMEVATISHKGPGAAFKDTYRELSEWIAENGYEWAGPSIEVYSKRPEVVDGETILYAKIMAPVKPK